MAIEKELLDKLLAGRDPKELFGKDGLVDELKKVLSSLIRSTSWRSPAMTIMTFGPGYAQRLM